MKIIIFAGGGDTRLFPLSRTCIEAGEVCGCGGLYLEGDDIVRLDDVYGRV